jgi:hypothetical protein
VSAQTGRPTVPPAPPSSRRMERVRAGFVRLRNDPNPIWMREMRQAARLQRTPIILAVVTGMMTLLIAAVGGIATVRAEPARVGVGLFHVFFSLGFAVVTWVGPAVAASTIASERSGRTWEALLLTGLGSPTIARGKFLAALTYVALYIVMLAPVGAMSFLFGGVTAVEVFTAFLLLGLFAALSVAFGLSISSKVSSNAVAIIVTLIVAVPLSLAGYAVLGPLLSLAVHELWPAIPAGPPVWLPTAYARVDFGVDYVTLLVLAPLLGVALPAWFLYEVTVANMASVNDDRSSGIRRWFLASAPLIAAVSLVPTFSLAAWESTIAAISILFAFAIFVTFVMAGEPLGPSRRVRIHWERRGVGHLQRALGPGLVRACSLLLIVIVALLVAQIASGALWLLNYGRPSGRVDAERVVAFGGYATAFFVFAVGFTTFVRARSTSATVPRLLLAAVLFLAAAGPWIAMAVAGLLSDGSDEALIVAAPSPLYAFVMMSTLSNPATSQPMTLLAGTLCASAWAFLGVLCFVAGTARARRIVREHDLAMGRVEAMLAAEQTQTVPVEREGQAVPIAEVAAP